MAKKLTQGQGWSLERDDDGRDAPIVSRPPAEQQIRLRLEKRSKGKSVTIIAPLVLITDDMKSLAAQLKAACGTGGTTRDDAIELQGDKRDAAAAWLRQHGWGVR